ncbi:MAG: DNA/RNA endonuclease [Flavobacteriaceae bacterium]|nr:DNA/RNA endonuclease [Flavobacteriaceae bacterium]
MRKLPLYLLFTHFCFGQLQFIPKSSGEVVNHKYYSLSYNEIHEQANWVHYKLNPNFLSGKTKRYDRFISDPLISSESAKPNEYRGSGYDRGHLAPAGDMKYNTTSMVESFYMSNISPQSPSFNRGGWKKLESLVREWGKKFEIYVTTGGVLDSNIICKIGENKISVPSMFYKIIYCPDKELMIGFLMPNVEIINNLKNYLVSIDEIELLTSIDFFSQLPDKKEDKLESMIYISDWDFEFERP